MPRRRGNRQRGATPEVSKLRGSADLKRKVNSNPLDSLPDLPHVPDTLVKGRTGDLRYAWSDVGPRPDRPKKTVQANRIDDVSIRDLDRVRFYPIVRDALNTLRAPLEQAEFHFVCSQAGVAEAAQEVLEQKICALRRIMFKGAFEFGWQAVEMVPEPVFDVAVTSGQADGQPVVRTYPFMWGVKQWNSFSPNDTRLLVNRVTGRFAGVRQYVTARTEHRDVERPYAYCFTHDKEFDGNYGVAKTKAAVPFVEAAYGVLDSMVQFADVQANPYKKVRYPFGKTVMKDASGARVEIDNGDRALEIADQFESGASACVPSDPWVFNGQASGFQKWDVDFEQAASSTADYVNQSGFINGMIRLSTSVPEMASGGDAPESGAYNLGEVQIKLFLRNLQTQLDVFEEVVNDFLYWWTAVNFGASCPSCKIKMRPVDLSTALMLLQALLQMAGTGEPVTDADGNLMYIDWAKVAQDGGVPTHIRKASKAAQDLTSIVADRLRKMSSAPTGEDKNAQIPPEDEINPDDKSAKLAEQWDESKHQRAPDGEFTGPGGTVQGQPFPYRDSPMHERRERVKAYLKHFVRQQQGVELNMPHQGWQIGVSNQTEHIASGNVSKAVADAAYNLPALIHASVLHETHEDRKSAGAGSDIEAIHRLRSRMLVDGKPTTFHITVKQRKDSGGGGKVLYHVQDLQPVSE